MKAHHAALETYRLAIQVVDSMRFTYWGEEAKLLITESASPIYEAAVQQALLLHQIKPDGPYLNLAYQLAATNKAAVLREQIRSEQAKNSTLLPDSLVLREREIRYLLDASEQALLLYPDSTALQNERFALYQEHLAALQRIKNFFPAYTQIKNESLFTDPASIQQQLGPGELLLEYFWGEEELHIFAIRQETLHHHSLPTEKSFVSSLQSFIAEVKQVENAENDQADKLSLYRKQAHYLFKQLVAPVFSSHALPPTLIYIIPDGPLGYLPFESLCTDAVSGDDFATLPYFMHQAPVLYLYAAELLWQNGKQAPQRSFAGFAPLFQGSRVALRGGPPGRLDNQTVAQSMAQQWQGQAYLGRQATKTKFLQVASEYQVLHLATHGFTDDENPALSGLWLEGEGSAKEILYAYEIYHQPLKAQLAVLSACETGTGQLLKGEGIYSLARAFTAAGCRSTLMSLWKVDDRSTRDLMLAFYAGLDEGLSTAEALQRARIRFLQTHDQVHPYYWSAFVLIGQNEQIHPISSHSLGIISLLGILGAVLLIAGIWYLRTQKRNNAN